MLDPPAGEHHHIGVGVRGDERRDVVERIQCAGEPEQHDAGAGDERGIEGIARKLPPRPAVSAFASRARSEASEILVDADAGGPGIRRPQRERAVLVADHDDRAVRRAVERAAADSSRISRSAASEASRSGPSTSGRRRSASGE